MSTVGTDMAASESESHVPTNALLDSLRAKERDDLVSRLETVNLSFGENVAEPQVPLRYVYFPTSSFLSVVTTIDEPAKSMEVGLIGSEGMLGALVTRDTTESPTRVTVRGAGEALRIETASFQDALSSSNALTRLVQRYGRVRLEQLMQSIACHRFHKLEPRVARWLLMTHDRARMDTFTITHEFLAYLLGVRRVGVTRAASALQRCNLIRYHRGAVTVVDRAGLEAASCCCYKAERVIYHRVMDA